VCFFAFAFLSGRSLCWPDYLFFSGLWAEGGEVGIILLQVEHWGLGIINYEVD
jgi:hypothetical protein